MPAPDPDGQVSLMLCESILHILVEEGVISNEKALDAINGVVELTRENDDVSQRRRLRRSGMWRIFGQRQMRPCPMIVGEISRQHAPR